jgi:hypothetical protein
MTILAALLLQQQHFLPRAFCDLQSFSNSRAGLDMRSQPAGLSSAQVLCRTVFFTLPNKCDAYCRCLQVPASVVLAAVAAYYVSVLDVVIFLTHSALLLLLRTGACPCGTDGNGRLLRDRTRCCNTSLVR